MKILQIFSRYTQRGGEEAAVEMLGKMLRQRHEVRELILVNPSSEGMGLLRTVQTGLKFFHNGGSCRKYRAMKQDFRPDLIILHNLFPEGSAALLMEIVRGKIPCIYYIHNFRPFSVNGYCWAGDKLEPAGLRRNFLPEILAGSWQGSRLRTLLFSLVLYSLHTRGAFRKMPAWIGISKFMTETFVKAGVPAERILTLPYPAFSDESGNPDPLPHLSKPGGLPVFLFLGRLCSEKGVPVLLEAWRKYQELGGTGDLILAGSGPLASQPNPPWEGMRNVRYAGLVDGAAKESLLRECWAVVIPSVWWEPYGLVVDEAFIRGKPVLAARSGGLAEAVTHGVNGWQHQPGDFCGLAEQLLEASSSWDHCHSLGRAGFLLAQSKTPQRWLDEFDRFAKSLTSAAVPADAAE